MGKNGVRAVDRVFPPRFKCVGCKHKMYFHNQNHCNVANCMCEINNPTFKDIIRPHIINIEKIIGGYRGYAPSY